MAPPKGTDGSLLAKLGDLAVSALLKPREETLWTLLPEATVPPSRPLKTGQEYVRVRLLAAHLPDVRKFFSTHAPLVYAGVGLGEIAGDDAEFAKVVSSGFKAEGLKGGNRETLSEVMLLNASPYSGTLNLALGLLSVRNSERARNLVKKVGELSEKAASPFIGEAAKTIGAVTNSVDLLTVDGSHVELGMMRSEVAPATGVYALYSDRGSKDEDIVFGFVNGRLVNNATKTPLRRPYIILSVEAIETREDAATIPRLKKKFEQVIETIEKGGASEDTIRAMIQDYAGMVSLWPDLLKVDRDHLVETAKKKFQEFRAARTGFESAGGGPEVVRPTLDGVVADALRARFGDDKATRAVAAATGETEQPLSLAEIAGKMTKAADQGDMLTVGALTAAAISFIRFSMPPFDQPRVKSIMLCLRAVRRFDDMKRMGETLLAQGERQPLFMKLHAQALIELKEPAAAELMLRQAEDLAKRTKDKELADIYGSLGRVQKDRFVDLGAKDVRARQDAFDRSLAYYRQGRKIANDPSNLYHTVNVMALASAGLRAGLKVPGDLKPKKIRQMAEDILRHVESARPNVQNWDYANAAEASLELGMYDDARDWLDDYARKNIKDAFSLNSTLRQITTLWGISIGGPNGRVVEGLQMALMGADNGAPLKVDGVKQLLASPDEARFEAIFNGETGISVQTAYKALSMSRFVGRVLQGDRAKGTGFLVPAKELLPGGPEADAAKDALLRRNGLDGGWLFLTNAHVCALDGAQGAATPDQAQVEFQVEGGSRHRIARLIWTSPVERHDCTILHLADYPKFDGSVAPARIAANLPKCRFAPGEKPARPRVLVLGHPEGRSLEITFNNNLLLDHEGPAVGQPFQADPVRVQYRAPTEPGSSGSPVFDADTLDLIAIHHRGKVPPIDKAFGDADRYQANQGMALRAIAIEFEAALKGAKPVAAVAAAPVAPAPAAPKPASEFAERVGESAFESMRSLGDWESDGAGLESFGAKSSRKLLKECGDFIAGFEISSPAYYKKKLESPIWPGGESGLTIGVGYDLRHASDAEFRADWGAHLSPEMIDALAPYCNKAESDLAERKKVVAALKPFKVSIEAAMTVFSDTMMPVHTHRTEAALDNTGELHDISMGALVSLVFNRGPSMADKDSRKEMRAIRDHMKAKTFDKIPAEIRAMKRLWEGKPDVAGLLTRREDEAAAFERGLALKVAAVA